MIKFYVMSNETINQRVINAINYLLEQDIVSKKGDIAVTLGCSPQTITEILGGRQGMKIELLQKFFERFNVSYQYIFEGRGDITTKKNTPTNTPVDTPLQPIFLPESGKTKSTNIVSLPIPVEPDEELVSVPLVDISVAAGSGFNNPTYMEEIDCIRFPQSMIKGNYTYLCVRIKGESMVPTLQDGGYLVVRLLDRSEWENIRDGHVYVVSDCEGKAYVKRIKNRLKEYGIIICNSDNPDPMGYPSFNLQENELHSVWHAEWYISAKMPNIHATYYNKVSELESAFDNMRREFKEELLQMRKEIRAVLPQ